VQLVSDLTKFSDRAIPDPKPIFLLKIRPGETKTVYFRIKGQDELVVPIHVSSSQTIQSKGQLRETLFGLFTGILAVMILYNLFLFLSLRTSIYFFYVINILPLFIGQSSLVGYANKFFWPNSNFWPDHAVVIFPLLSIIFGLTFMSRFINLKRHMPWSIWAINVFIGVSVIGIGFSLIGETAIASIILNANGMVSALVIITICAILTRRQVSSAKFVLVAWTIFLIGVILYVLRSLNILSYSLLTNYSMPIGAAIETLLLSFALADRINILKKQREESQQLMLMEVKKNNDLTRNQNKVLEEKVKKRTEELEVMNLNLQDTLSNLKSTQGHLMEAEKMASLGQITAGIAHEINNPINYVSSNVEPLRQDLGDILTILDGYKTVAKNSDLPELKALLTQEEELDIDYAIKDMHELLGGIEEGAKRTSEIVTGLKSFSRTDEDEAQSADINNGIRSTITILKSELKDIETVVELGSIPHIKCYLGKLNQIFMNLIDNAIDAIKDRYEDRTKGVLTVVTSQVDNKVIVKITDNGCGMPEDVKNRIFDPFYTTKDVGKGTGLGLSISYGIMEKHNGHISVESEPHVGTTFTIELPIDSE
jgi:signal transduction histidine kinase